MTDSLDFLQRFITLGAYIIGVVSIMIVLYKRFVASRSLPAFRSGADHPLLNAYYTNGKSLAPLHQGKFGQLDYVLYTTAVTVRKSFGRDGREHTNVSPGGSTLICCVTLPFKSACHLIGITENGSATFSLKDYIVSRGLEPVVLEGDFPRYAYLYSPPGNQVNARYLMDPNAMAYVADFCKTHHWEIVGNYLYFVSGEAVEGEKVAEDPTPIMTEDIERFVAEIRPAVEDSVA